MRQKLESIGSLLDRCLKRSDSGLPTVTLQLYESNEPVRLKASVLAHSDKWMALRVDRSISAGQRVSVLITCSIAESEIGLDEELKIEASGKIVESDQVDPSLNQFEVSVQLKGRYGVVIDNESSRRKK